MALHEPFIFSRKKMRMHRLRKRDIICQQLNSVKQCLHFSRIMLYALKVLLELAGLLNLPHNYRIDLVNSSRFSILTHSKESSSATSCIAARVISLGISSSDATTSFLLEVVCVVLTIFTPSMAFRRVQRLSRIEGFSTCIVMEVIIIKICCKDNTFSTYLQISGTNSPLLSQ